MLLPAFDALQTLHGVGFADTRSLHHLLHGCDLPPTCKDATWIAQALLCPRLTARLQKVAVLDVWYFDAHNRVVTIELQVKPTIREMHWKLPRSWIELPIETSHIHDAFRELSKSSDPPDAIRGEPVEQAVDQAYRKGPPAKKARKAMKVQR